jgi:hypothetical protein
MVRGAMEMLHLKIQWCSRKIVGGFQFASDIKDTLFMRRCKGGMKTNGFCSLSRVQIRGLWTAGEVPPATQDPSPICSPPRLLLRNPPIQNPSGAIGSPNSPRSLVHNKSMMQGVHHLRNNPLSVMGMVGRCRCRYDLTAQIMLRHQPIRLRVLVRVRVSQGERVCNAV